MARRVLSSIGAILIFDFRKPEVTGSKRGMSGLEILFCRSHVESPGRYTAFEQEIFHTKKTTRRVIGLRMLCPDEQAGGKSPNGSALPSLPDVKLKIQEVDEAYESQALKHKPVTSHRDDHASSHWPKG